MMTAVAIGLLLLLAACTTSQPAGTPSIEIFVRNHTDAAVDYVVTTREPDANGSMSGPVAACDAGGALFSEVDDQTWRATVDGASVIDSDDPLPEVGPGEVLEIFIEVRPNQEPEIGDMTVRAEGNADRQRSEGEWQAVLDGLECEKPPLSRRTFPTV